MNLSSDVSFPCSNQRVPTQIKVSNRTNTGMYLSFDASFSLLNQGLLAAHMQPQVESEKAEGKGAKFAETRA